MLSTAEDLVRFGVGVTDSSFLAREAEALFKTQQTNGGEPTGNGFGFEVGESPVRPVAGHTGNVVGGTAFLLIHPQTRVVVAMTTNVGLVTVPSPPDHSAVPDPPQLAMPSFAACSRRAAEVGRPATSPTSSSSRQLVSPA